ncbi:hypothetical protein FBX97_5790 [Herbaspirillum sp. SJZ107]|nr:hypothetical protein FBX97_5790 [Herbaspirillum sp. SJZ107]
MYSFHRRHHALTLSWLGYLAAVRQMRVDIQEKGVLAALKTLSKTDNYIGETLR